jgi:hypothetical protein
MRGNSASNRRKSKGEYRRVKMAFTRTITQSMAGILELAQIAPPPPELPGTVTMGPWPFTISQVSAVSAGGVIGVIDTTALAGALDATRVAADLDIDFLITGIDLEIVETTGATPVVTDMSLDLLQNLRNSIHLETDLNGDTRYHFIGGAVGTPQANESLDGNASAANASSRVSRPVKFMQNFWWNPTKNKISLVAGVDFDIDVKLNGRLYGVGFQNGVAVDMNDACAKKYRTYGQMVNKPFRAAPFLQG